MFFGVVDFLQKTNEKKSIWGIIVVKSNSFVRFLEEIDDPKNHFEINWPLQGATQYLPLFLCTLKLRNKGFFKQLKCPIL